MTEGLGCARAFPKSTSSSDGEATTTTDTTRQRRPTDSKYGNPGGMDAGGADFDSGEQQLTTTPGYNEDGRNRGDFAGRGWAESGEEYLGRHNGQDTVLVPRR
ncbi:hypothetical protein M0804_002928 [Polistes exclamans]|nr:hypothetical protein M0804_002928 [Polistes exclamans]